MWFVVAHRIVTNCQNAVFLFHYFVGYCLYHFPQVPLSLRDTFKNRKSSHLHAATDCLPCLCHENRVQVVPSSYSWSTPVPPWEAKICVVAAVAGQGNTPVPSLMPPFCLAAAGFTYPFFHFTPPLRESQLWSSYSLTCLPSNPEHAERKGYCGGEGREGTSWTVVGVKESKSKREGWGLAPGGGGEFSRTQCFSQTSPNRIYSTQRL